MIYVQRRCPFGADTRAVLAFLKLIENNGPRLKLLGLRLNNVDIAQERLESLIEANWISEEDDIDVYVRRYDDACSRLGDLIRGDA